MAYLVVIFKGVVIKYEHYCKRFVFFQVGSPEKTAWTINDKGNRVWFSYEHTPTLFPVTETRFYKPKLHKMDFLGKRKKEEDGRNI